MSITTTEVAIVGVGATEQGEIPGQTADEIAVRAAVLALVDAGIDKSAIDGLITCRVPRAAGASGTDESVGQLLGINPAFSTTLAYGACGFSLHVAAAVVAAGLADTVLLTYGSDQRSRRADFAVSTGDGAEWRAMAGLFHIGGQAAMAARRHMHLFGTTEEQLGWISVAQREWAMRNPLAIFRTPMTIEDYLNSPYTVAPLRRADLTMISDGGAAVIVTRADRVGDFRPRPVHLLGMAQQTGLRSDQNPDRFLRPWIRSIAEKLYGRAGLTAADIDAAYLQDATSVWVLQMLEWYGFCGQGEAGPFVAEGHTRPGGSLPVNTNGGQLSEAYMWNWLHLYEAVRQLRGECGDRQLPDVEVALHAQTHDFVKGAATLLSTRRA